MISEYLAAVEELSYFLAENPHLKPLNDVIEEALMDKSPEEGMIMLFMLMKENLDELNKQLNLLTQLSPSQTLQ